MQQVADVGLHPLGLRVPVAADLVPETQALHLLVGLGHNYAACYSGDVQKHYRFELVAAVEAAEVCYIGQHSMAPCKVLSRLAVHDQQA